MTENEKAEKYCEGVQAEIMEAIQENGGVWEYLNDVVLDYDFRINSERTYEGGRIWVTIGGPSVWIDTEDGTINYRESFNDPYKWWMCEEASEACNAWLEEVFYSGN